MMLYLLFTIYSGKNMKKNNIKKTILSGEQPLVILKKIITLYFINYHCFCEKYYISNDTLRY